MAIIPTKLPTFVCKCVWDATALYIKVEAKDEAQAWDNSWKKVAKMEGGATCLQVKVLRRV